MQDAIRQTYQQYMTDMLILTLNDPEVMGKDLSDRLDSTLKVRAAIRSSRR